MTATVEQPVMEFTTPTGQVARFAVRPDTNDSALVAGILGGSEYPFERLTGLTGWAIDIGAHIGIVTVALALANPGLRIVAVEALRENVDVLRRNLELNGFPVDGVTGRVGIVHAAIGIDADEVEVGYGYEYVPDESDEANRPGGYVQASRWIGNLYAPREGMRSLTRLVGGISLTRMLDTLAITDVVLLKIDCEGCEWTVLADPSISRCQRIVGELHGGAGMAGLRKLLPGFAVTQLDANPTNPIFEAVRL